MMKAVRNMMMFIDVVQDQCSVSKLNDTMSEANADKQSKSENNVMEEFDANAAEREALMSKVTAGLQLVAPSG